MIRHMIGCGFCGGRACCDRNIRWQRRSKAAIIVRTTGAFQSMKHLKGRGGLRTISFAVRAAKPPNKIGRSADGRAISGYVRYV
jgi:hypothetical protein